MYSPSYRTSFEQIFNLKNKTVLNYLANIFPYIDTGVISVFLYKAFIELITGMPNVKWNILYSLFFLFVFVVGGLMFAAISKERLYIAIISSSSSRIIHTQDAIKITSNGAKLKKVQIMETLISLFLFLTLIFTLGSSLIYSG